MKLLSVLFIATTCAGLASCASRGHVRPAVDPQDPFPDTSAWKPILAYANVWLRPTVEARDSNKDTPWKIELPSADNPWPTVRAILSRNLGARAALPSDSMYRTLRISPLTIRGDTAEAQLVTGRHRRCPQGSGTSGHENSQIIVVVRVPTTAGPQWSSARSRIHGAGSYVCFR